MKQLIFVFGLVLALGFGFSSMQARAQVSTQLAPRLGLDISEEIGGETRFFIGADARFTSPTLPVVVNPVLDWYFADNFNFWAIKANALYPISTGNPAFAPYAGGGLGIYTASNGDSETEFGIGGLFGVLFIREASFTPFVEAEYDIVFSDPENLNLFSFKGGLLFDL
jgi:hypothetical protein